MALKDFIKSRLGAYSMNMSDLFNRYKDEAKSLIIKGGDSEDQAIKWIADNEDYLKTQFDKGEDEEDSYKYGYLGEDGSYSKTKTYSIDDPKFDDIVQELMYLGWTYFGSVELTEMGDKINQMRKEGKSAKEIARYIDDNYKSSLNAYSKSDTTKLSSLKSWAEIEELLTQLGFKKDKASYHEGKCLNSFGISSGTKNPKDEFFYHEAIMPNVESYFLTCSGEDDEGRGTFLGEDIIGCISKDPFTKSIYFISTKETTIGDLKKILEESNGESLLNVSGDEYLNFKVIKVGE